MGLPYIKTEIIGVDLYMLGCRSPLAFTIYWVLVSHSFEHAATSIPLDIAKQKMLDFTDDIDNVINMLKLRGLITIDDNNLILPKIKDRLINGIEFMDNRSKHNKKYYDKNKDKAKDIEQDTNNDDNTDYRPLVQQWNSISPMSDIQLKTSYSRFKTSNSWDPETVTRAIEFIGKNQSIKNRVMCDWFEAGFFLPGYEFNVDTINDYFSKKGNGYNGKKVNGNRSDCGTGVVYDDQGHPPPQWNTRKLSGYAKTNEPSEQDIELKRQLEEVLE